MFYTKYFAKKLTAISCNFFFHNKIYKYFIQKNFKTKLAGNINFFSSGEEEKERRWRRCNNAMMESRTTIVVEVVVVAKEKKDEWEKE